MNNQTTTNSNQEMSNKSFDPKFNLIQTESVGYDPVNDVMRPSKVSATGANVSVLEDEAGVSYGVKQTNNEPHTRSKIFDSWGDEIGSTMIDEIMTAEKSRICGGVFNGTTPDPNFYTTTLSNATATISNSVLDLATTTTSGSNGIVYTNSLGRYIGGNMNHLRGIYRVGDTGVANNVRQIGCTSLSDLADSFYFQLEGTTFSIVANTTGLSQIKINNGSFNGDAATYPITNTFHTWEILFTNRRIQFYIDKTLIHTLTQTTDPICGTRHLRPFIRNANTGVGSVTHLYTQSLSLVTWGKTKTQPKYYYRDTTTAGVQLKVGIGSVHMINFGGVSNGAIITLYDGTSTAGAVIYSTGVMGPQTVPTNVPFNDGVVFQNGLFLVIGGANANCQVIYE